MAMNCDMILLPEQHLAAFLRGEVAGPIEEQCGASSIPQADENLDCQLFLWEALQKVVGEGPQNPTQDLLYNLCYCYSGRPLFCPDPRFAGTHAERGLLFGAGPEVVKELLEQTHSALDHLDDIRRGLELAVESNQVLLWRA